MSRTVVRRLVAKDLYLSRWPIVVAIGGGLAGLAVAGVSRLGFNIGSIAFITALVAFGIISGFYGVVQERKERSHLFVLSLPVSTTQYMKAKVLALLGGYLIPWTILTAGAVVLIVASPIPDGLIPFATIVSTFFLCTFCVFIATALITTSEALITAAIIVTNMSVSFFFILVSRIPSIAEGVKSAQIEWSAPVLVILAAEIAVAVLSLALALHVGSRKRDFA